MSYWIDEYNVSKGKSCIPLSSVCNVNCIFCSNKNNPFELPKAEFRNYDDIIKNIKMLKVEKYIKLSDNIPGRIKEGESLLHPRLFDVLDEIRIMYPDIEIIFTTNGSMLNEEMVLNLSLYKPIIIDTLSINTTNNDLWVRLMNGTSKQAEIAINAPKLLYKYGIPFLASLVAMPEITGYEDIYKTIKYVDTYGCIGSYIWLPGHTNKTPERLQKLMSYDITKIKNEVKKLNDEGVKKINIVPETDVNKIVNRMHKIKENYKNYRNLILCSEAAFDSIKSYFSENNDFTVICAKNRTYGGNIKVSGLLFVEDFKKCLKEIIVSKEIEFNNVIIPLEPFDLEGNDLNRAHYLELLDSKLEYNVVLG